MESQTVGHAERLSLSIWYQTEDWPRIQRHYLQTQGHATSSPACSTSDNPLISHPSRGIPGPGALGCHPVPLLSPLYPTSHCSTCPSDSISLILSLRWSQDLSSDLRTAQLLVCLPRGLIQDHLIKSITDPGWPPKDPAAWPSLSLGKHRSISKTLSRVGSSVKCSQWP